MNKNFVVGVIGAGRMGAIHIENLLKRIPRIELRTVADLKLDNQLREWGSEIGIHNLTDNADEILTDPEIDVVVIASSTDTHANFIQKAAENNKHIFCEKPIDTDLKRIKETLKIIKDSGVKFMVGFNRRFDHNFKRIHDTIFSGQIGTPQVIKITSRDPAPPSIEYIKHSGGIFLDMTIHDWDMARYLTGNEIEEIYATGGNLIDPNIGEAGDIDTAVVILKFKNGALAIIDNSRQAVYGYDQRVEVFCSDGCAIAENDTQNSVRIYTDENITSDKIPYFFLERYMNSFASELQHFFYCLNNNQEPSPNGYDGLQDVLIALAAQKSLVENRPVKISEVDI